MPPTPPRPRRIPSARLWTDLVREVDELREKYAVLLRGIKSEAKYEKWFEHLEDDSDWFTKPSGEKLLRISFRDTVSAVLDMMSRAKDVLVVRAEASEAHRRILRAFGNLEFVRKFDYYIQCDPYRTLDGLTSLATLMREVDRTQTGNSVSPTLQSNPVNAGVLFNPELVPLDFQTIGFGGVVSNQGEGSVVTPKITRDRRQPHPDPESILQNHPMGVPKKTAAEIFGVGKRRIEQLIYDEGALATRGKGNAMRVTCESIRDLLTRQKNSAMPSKTAK